MASSSDTTTDHKTIRAWAEEREGKPVTVRGTGDGDHAGVLRFDFPGGAGADRLEEISWDEWFEKFDDSGLALLYQDHKADGETSTFFKLVNREGADDDKPRAKKADSKHDDDKDDDKKSDHAHAKAEKDHEADNKAHAKSENRDDHAKAEKNGHVNGHKAEAKKDDDKDKKEHAKEREKAGAHAKK